MEKVLVLETNNQLSQLKLPLYHPTESELLGLYQYVVNQVHLESLSELEQFLAIMNWVHKRFEHNGFNNGDHLTSLELLKRAEKGENYRCAEYARITRDLLLAFGYVARVIRVLSENADYGGVGQSHVCSEVWSTEQEKWIFLDTQCNVYASMNETPLSYYELIQTLEHASIHCLLEKGVSETVYKRFISVYQGYVTTDAQLDGKIIDFVLHLKGKRQLLAFQAMQLSNAVYTQLVEDIYGDPTKTSIIFEYKEQVNPEKVIKEHGLNGSTTIADQLHLFRAEPNFKLVFHTVNPMHNYFKVWFNQDSERELQHNQLDWHLEKGTHSIRVQSVHSSGVAGTVTKMVIRFGEDM
ncbi:transglutaminase-like domain-containing protein [Shouchella lehensis]|nr:transglutaminase-like domain-containing protein [Shouchella lehensis]MBG9784938.1 hypothetical protein [Shouchella lehensis]